MEAQALWPMRDMRTQLRHAATEDSCTSILLRPSNHDQMFAAGHLESYMTA